MPLVVFGHSRYLGETLIQNPDLLASLLQEKNIDQRFSRDEFHEALAHCNPVRSEADVSLLLARFKRREYIRIMLRDVLKIAPLRGNHGRDFRFGGCADRGCPARGRSRKCSHAMTPLSTLGPRRPPCDHAFFCPGAGQTGGQRTQLQLRCGSACSSSATAKAPGLAAFQPRIFRAPGAEVTEILSRVTREGAGYRIDLRLRPQGRGRRTGDQLLPRAAILRRRGA